MTPDVDLGAYCRAIEAHLCRVNGGHLIRVVGVAFDLVARRAIPIPPAQRTALEALLIPGLGL